MKSKVIWGHQKSYHENLLNAISRETSMDRIFVEVEGHLRSYEFKTENIVTQYIKQGNMPN